MVKTRGRKMRGRKTRGRKMRRTRRMRGGACPSDLTFAVGVTECYGKSDTKNPTERVQECINTENNKQPGGCNYDLAAIKSKLSTSITTALNSKVPETREQKLERIRKLAGI